MTPQEKQVKQVKQVKRFYHEIWNAHDKTIIAEVMHESVTFRGSLGQSFCGHAGFIIYLDMIHDALSNYHCEIQELVCDNDKVFARMEFSGLHSGTLMGYPATQQTVTWPGAALFTFTQDKVMDLWVLGDIKSLEQQLQGKSLSE